MLYLCNRFNTKWEIITDKRQTTLLKMTNLRHTISAVRGGIMWCPFALVFLFITLSLVATRMAASAQVRSNK